MPLKPINERRPKYKQMYMQKSTTLSSSPSHSDMCSVPKIDSPNENVRMRASSVSKMRTIPTIFLLLSFISDDKKGDDLRSSPFILDVIKNKRK